MQAIAEAQENAGDFLGRVEEELQRMLGDDPAVVGVSGADTLMSAARHLVLAPGAKRARPMLVQLFGRVLGMDEERILPIAACAELVHSASLLHDDVLDAGMFRRSRPTVNARWGNSAAVLSGDLMLTIAMARVAAIDSAVTRSAVATVAEMTRASIAEIEARGDLGLPTARLRTIAEGKTGSLFAWCGVAVAELAGDDEARARLDAFGRRLGIAFQLADDVRDITGTDPGKPRYADLASRNLSWPILLAAAEDIAVRREIRDLWAFAARPPEKVEALGQRILETGALARTIASVEEEAHAAIDALGELRSRDGGEALAGWALKLAESVRNVGP